MLAKERWELSAMEEQRRAQEKERAKVEFRYRVQTVFYTALTSDSTITIIVTPYLWSFSCCDWSIDV